MCNKIKKVAAIHDLAGLGRCSLTAVIPILSVLGVQPCPLPTAILSCQTDYKDFFFLDLTNIMEEYKSNWSKKGFEFDGIYSGFLGSKEQIRTVIGLIKEHKNAFVIIDPVMGDDGDIYETYTTEMCESMKELVKHADVVTPNLTECCILTNRDYETVNKNNDELLEMCKEITNMGPDKVVITGIVCGNYVKTFAFDKNTDKFFVESNGYNGKSYSGTGDIFASIVSGMLINGYGFYEAVKKACSFIKLAVDYSDLQFVDGRNGIYFEPYLKELLM